jgi:hypothetical protein
MSFQLTIAEGKEAGKEFVFEQDSVLIGRVAECDVVLYDAGISRRHARIFSEAGAYFVEDVGSSNGTLVNGQPVKQKHALIEGDQVTLGPVVFVYRRVPEMDPEEATAPMPAATGSGSTRIVALDAVSKPRQRNKGEALVPEGADAEALGAAQRTATRAMPALASESAPAPRPTRSSGAAALARPGESAPAPSRRAAAGGAPARAAPAGGAKGLSAAERARIRRESPGMLSKLKIFWFEARPPVRHAILGAGGLLVLGLVGLMFFLVLDEDKKVVRGPEPKSFSNVGDEIITDSFGLGDDVMWENADQKTFDFEYTTAIRTLAILHFQAQGLSEKEVVVTVNGADLGTVPADTLASQDRELEMIIPYQLLKKGQVNHITFDNTKNPPGDDPWAIWNLRLERVPLPELPPDQLLEEARKANARGLKHLQTVKVGARNGFEAWKSFREAWLLLYAYPDPRPDLFNEAREHMNETQALLDRTCSKLMLEVERYVTQSNWQAVSATLDHTNDYFPDKSQLCAQKAQKKRDELGL